MSACTFFGHRDCPIEIKHLLKKATRELIKNSKVKNFYVGNHGDFDKVVLKVLKELKKEFPEIIYSVVLAYIPIKTGEGNIIDYSYTIIPEGIEKSLNVLLYLTETNGW
ncbi:MAG: hypothetical protein J6C82_03155 [Clostridia bacterium]|nr:hypothetical protein [Clostridia bacterium]